MEVLWGVGVCHSACMHSLVHLYMVDWVLADSARLSQTLQMSQKLGLELSLY